MYLLAGILCGHTNVIYVTGCKIDIMLFSQGQSRGTLNYIILNLILLNISI